jgi:hypothetical protein
MSVMWEIPRNPAAGAGLFETMKRGRVAAEPVNKNTQLFLPGRAALQVRPV